MAGASKLASASVEVDGIDLKYLRGGKGNPVVVLHNDIGMPPRTELLDALSGSYDVIAPHQPGYGVTARADWMRSARDVAVVYRAMLHKLGTGPCSLVGLGFGGYVAAEMATFAPADVDKLVLVGAMGVKPPEGYILDEAIISYIDYARACFNDQKAFDALYGAEPTTDQLEVWDICREMNFRIAWKPYKYNPTLPHLLASVTAPALIVWGAEDKVVPRSAGEAYKKALPSAKLELVEGCGHAVALERPAELVKLVSTFLGAKAAKAKK